MGRSQQDVQIFGVQDRRGRSAAKRPWVIRWRIDGRDRSKAFRTKTEAERHRAALLQAQLRGERFDDETGQPGSWTPAVDDMAAHEWARRWLAEQWDEWQPRTRASAVEALARLVPLLVIDLAPTPPAGLRLELHQSLRPGVGDAEGPGERWLDRWSLRLSDLDRARLAIVDQRLRVGDNGQPLASTTVARYRNVSRACIRRAVELDVLPIDPWPPAPRGRQRRKINRSSRAVDVRALPDPPTMARALEAMISHQPASRMYQMMTAVAYYAGLRPSEVVMLQPRCLDLPESGWGAIEVREADVDVDEPGEPKTGPRSVPIPPQLVACVRDWLDTHDFAPTDRIFRTKNGTRPLQSNWRRAWLRALSEIDHPPLRIYDCRHAAATTWLQAGVPLGEVAIRMGHSVETLVSTYVGALAGDEAVANDKIEAFLGGNQRA